MLSNLVNKAFEILVILRNVVYSSPCGTIKYHLLTGSVYCLKNSLRLLKAAWATYSLIGLSTLKSVESNKVANQPNLIVLTGLYRTWYFCLLFFKCLETWKSKFAIINSFQCYELATLIQCSFVAIHMLCVNPRFYVDQDTQWTWSTILSCSVTSVNNAILHLVDHDYWTIVVISKCCM